MANHILLVEPAYYSKFPPIGLLKLSTYHRSKGDTTEYIDFEKKRSGFQQRLPRKFTLPVFSLGHKSLYGRLLLIIKTPFQKLKFG